jgi:acetyltransferase-like isoleucine patch superfamily enzyme
MKNTKLRKMAALAISLLPGSALRVQAYSLLLGYQFGPGTKLGWGVMIAVDSFRAGNKVAIRRNTTFVGPIRVDLGDHTFIGRSNKIECGDSAADPSQAHMNYAREFITGRDSLINEAHLFDVLGRIQIGDGTWVAGFASQFLTHGAGAMNRDILIGANCFLGSAVRFAPGSGIGDRVMVGMGAVVTKRILENDVVVAGLPAKIIKERSEDDGYVFNKVWES